jgi:hypothetical protein
MRKRFIATEAIVSRERVHPTDKEVYLADEVLQYNIEANELITKLCNHIKRLEMEVARYEYE